MNGFRFVAVFAIGLFLGSASFLRADVLYTFSGTTLGGPLPNGALQEFTFLSPVFITTDTLLPATSLTSCSTSYSVCGGVGFRPDNFFGAHYSIIDFSVPNAGWFYYFPLDTFATVGTHSTLFNFNPGTLTVTVTPEPSVNAFTGITLTMLLLLLGTRRLRRAKRATEQA
jgi:hypothetical protein